MTKNAKPPTHEFTITQCVARAHFLHRRFVEEISTEQSSTHARDVLELIIHKFESTEFKSKHSQKHLLGEFMCLANSLTAAHRAIVLRATAAYIVSRFKLEKSCLKLPHFIANLYPIELKRILDSIEVSTVDIDFNEDRWRKNIAIASGRLIPAGAEFFEVDSGIPRSLLFTCLLTERFALARTVLLELRGFRPLIELHAHPDSLSNFNPAGWIRTYRVLAEVLQSNPSLKGVMASSWFRDPQLSEISPHLKYLRDYPLQHGAKIFYTKDDPAGESGALNRSKNRQQLFRAGLYVPRIHLLIWPRTSLLNWHATNDD